MTFTGLRIPGTFEIVAADGRCDGTFTREGLPLAEIILARLIEEQPDAGWRLKYIHEDERDVRVEARHLFTLEQGQDSDLELRYGHKRFWDEWDSELTERYWCRTETDRHGARYTIKWHSDAYRSNGCGRVVSTTFMVADGVHPHRRPPKHGAMNPVTELTQPPRRLCVGERLRNAQGVWRVDASWYAVDGKARYVLTRSDGHQETRAGTAMADFHLIPSLDS
ncbi:hypothetical protein ACFZBU_42370 [Embleya sp. NPDC008237]|uniref:hypothetical protein n=1 Tax=Embleya sp. NPDC008237 TaxID=3363978 RepID=UPI0036EBD5C0